MVQGAPQAAPLSPRWPCAWGAGAITAFGGSPPASSRDGATGGERRGSRAPLAAEQATAERCQRSAHAVWPKDDDDEHDGRHAEQHGHDCSDQQRHHRPPAFLPLSIRYQPRLLTAATRDAEHRAVLARARAHSRCCLRTLLFASAAAHTRCGSLTRLLTRHAVLRAHGAARSPGRAQRSRGHTGLLAIDPGTRGHAPTGPVLPAALGTGRSRRGTDTSAAFRLCGLHATRGGGMRHTTAPRQGIPSAAPQRLWREGD